MVQCGGGPAQRPQMTCEHTAEEEEHLRTLTRLAYLEKWTEDQSRWSEMRNEIFRYSEHMDSWTVGPRK